MTSIANVLLFGRAAGLIFVSTLDRTASAISIQDICQMRRTHGVQKDERQSIAWMEIDTERTRITKGIVRT